MLRSRRLWVTLLLSLSFAGAGVGVLSADGGHDGAQGSASSAEPARGAPSRPTRGDRDFVRGLDPLVHTLEDGHYVTELAAGRRAVLTLDPALQDHVVHELEANDVPYAALVAIEPATGRVLAYVSHSSANPDAGDLALDPTPPTASVFKIVTAAALLDRGVSTEARTCYHGGSSSIVASHLEDAASDRDCATLGEAIGGSINAVMAKLADRNLDTPTLERYASAFGFGQTLPFDVPTRASPAEIPDHEADRLEFARTAAGFWHVHMSPFHAALIAATFANDGRMPRASMIDRVLGPDGEVLLRQEPEVFRAVISRHTAREVGEMMELTVTDGTARRTFHDPAGNAFIPGVRIAGKTGTLSGTDPYRGYTWWVGFAPADAPTIAVAALVVNTPRWRIKASYLAREALRNYLVR